MLAERRAFAVFSHLFKRARGNAKVASRLRCIQEWARNMSRVRTDRTASVLDHRSTASECGHLYVPKFRQIGRAKMAARQNRQAEDYAPETAYLMAESKPNGLD